MTRRMGWNLKRDASERPIIQALRKVGCQVLPLDKFDLLVLTPRQTLHMLETKTGKGKATEAQHALVRDGWPLQFVATVEEAFAAVGLTR
jgi:hypothetical protein